MKEVIKTEDMHYSRSVDMGTKLTFVTDDNTMYVFWDLPWYNYPVFSHREYRKDSDKPIDEAGGVIHTDSRNFNLPDQVEESIWDKYGGYYMADGKVDIVEKEKRGRTVVKPDVGDMYPLREP